MYEPDWQFFHEINRRRFHTARRLMYNCPASFGDGLPIDYRISDLDTEAAIGKLKFDVDRIDICLIDGWHTYDCAIRDLSCTYDMLADGGVLVVHDCSPTNETVASPTWVHGEWSGVSYRSYLDFVLSRDDLDYCTVDTDFGCEIILKDYSLEMVRTILPYRDPRLAAQWFRVHKDDKLAFEFLFEES